VTVGSRVLRATVPLVSGGARSRLKVVPDARRFAMSEVATFLEEAGVEYEVIPHRRAARALDEAQEIGLSADEILKTIVLHTRHGYAVAVIPGYRRLDMALVHRATGDHDARLATEGELIRDFPQFELGAFPPLGTILKVPVYVDPEALRHDIVVFAAGRQFESIRMRTEDLFFGESMEVVPISGHPEDAEEKEPVGLLG
jgi:Ala-tRNA(Pro) deacylase